jgi:hypothetical protein
MHVTTQFPSHSEVRFSINSGKKNIVTHIDLWIAILFVYF